MLLELGGAVGGGEVAEPAGRRVLRRMRLLEHEPELTPPRVEAGALVARANPRLRGGSEERLALMARRKESPMSLTARSSL